jgi:Spy/CpxP family protein refolding chaperone
MKTTLAAALFTVALTAAPIPYAADKAGDVTDLTTLRAAVQKDKRGVVATTLGLTDVEARRFWPIYDTYQRALEAVDRRRSRAVIDVVGIDRVSDPYAKTLAAELIAIDEAEIRARRTLQNRLMRALPPRKAVRYLELESKIRALEAYDIAAALPLAK